MVNDVGKTAATIIYNNALYHFYNSTFLETEDVDFYDDFGNVRYRLSVSNTAGYNYRSMHYSRSFFNNGMNDLPRPVLYAPTFGTAKVPYGIPALPLFEAISPNACVTSDMTQQITWWSNTSEALQPNLLDPSRYDYDASKIMKFSTDSLGDVEASTNCSKILCSAGIKWELLRQGNGLTIDLKCIWMPIITDILVLQCISGDGYVVDFSTGGGGSGIGMHSHTSNDDGGLAVATFAPSAMLRPMAWS